MSPARYDAPTPEPKAATGLQGYIKIEDTNIDYPIILGEDNDFYLTHDINGKKAVRGSIFLDYRNAYPKRRRNLCLYGHNMKDKSMFTNLHKYEDESFMRSHMQFDMELFGKKYSCQVIYVAQIDYRDYNFIRTKFDDDQAFLDFINEALTKQARFKDKDYVPSADDQLVTLVTCVSRRVTNKEYTRWILVAKLGDPVGEAEHEFAGFVN